MERKFKLAAIAATALFASAATSSAEHRIAEPPAMQGAGPAMKTSGSSNSCCWIYQNGFWYCIPCA